MKTVRKKMFYSQKKGQRKPKCNPAHCTQCIFFSMLQADISNKGKMYGKIKYSEKNGKLQFTSYDESISKILGYSIQELKGKDPSVILHPADKKMMMQRVKDRIQGKTVEYEYLARVKRKDGTYIIIKVAGASASSSWEYPEAEFIISTYCPPTEEVSYKERTFIGSTGRKKHKSIS